MNAYSAIPDLAIEINKSTTNVSSVKSVPSGTLHQPGIDENILCCSKILFRHIDSTSNTKTTLYGSTFGRHQLPPTTDFDLDNFVEPEYDVIAPLFSSSSSICSMMAFKQTRKNVLPVHTDTQTIFTLIKRLFDRAYLHAECAIISLIYVERLLEKSNIRLTSQNWVPIVMCALLTASKVWDDHSSFNAEFASIVPFFTLSSLNALERQFLNALDYSLYVSQSEYARFYFALRTLRHQPKVRDVRSQKK